MTHFAWIPHLTAAAAVALVATAGHAQDNGRDLASAVRECRRLADASARTACYDGIELEERSPAEQAPPPPAAAVEPRADTGFGSNQLPRARTAEASEPGQISARVARAVERQPGIYLLTLEDGTEWQFVDSAPANYDPPRPGSTIEISKASMGSYLVRYAGQRSVRTRRVR